MTGRISALLALTLTGCADPPPPAPITLRDAPALPLTPLAPLPAPPPSAVPAEWAVALTLHVQAEGGAWRASLIRRPGPLRASGRADPDDRVPPWSPLGCDQVDALLPGSRPACARLQADRALHDPARNRSRCDSPPPGDLDALIAWTSARLADTPLPGRLSIVAAPGTPADGAARLAGALRPLAPDLDLRSARIRAGNCGDPDPTLPPIRDELIDLLSTQALRRPACEAAPSAWRLALTVDGDPSGEQVSAEVTCAICPPDPPASGAATLLVDADPALDTPLRFLRSAVRDDDLFACFADQLRDIYRPDPGTRFEATVRFQRTP